MTYEERWEDTVLERGWAAVRQQVGVILAVFGFTSAAQMTVLWGAQRLILARMLRPIEALVRRLVLVMALRLTPSEPRDAPRPQKTSDRACNTPLQRRARGVCLFEPWPSIKPPHLRKPFARPAPRIWAWDKDGFLIGAPRPPDPIPLAPGAHVLARFNGLVAILDKPDSAARRLASWLARREPYRRATPLKLGAPPVPQRCELREVVLNTHHFAVCAMDRRAKDQRSRLLSSAPPDSS